MSNTSSTTLTGELVSFRELGADGWGSGRLQVQANNRVELVTFTGKLLGASPGDGLELVGVWTTHPKYGRQFKVKQCTSKPPQTVEGIVAWMTSTLPDIGEQRARVLVERFGAGLWETIERTPLALCAINGITPKRAHAIADAYKANRADRDALIALRGYGLTDAQVRRCVDRWETLEDAVANIRANPYDLIDAVPGFGFKRADAVALLAGVAKDSPVRMAAALWHVLNETVATRGHVFVPSGELRARTATLLEVTPAEVWPALRAQLAAGRVVMRAQRIYAAGLEHSEATAAEALERLLRRKGE